MKSRTVPGRDRQTDIPWEGLGKELWQGTWWTGVLPTNNIQIWNSRELSLQAWWNLSWDKVLGTEFLVLTWPEYETWISYLGWWGSAFFLVFPGDSTVLWLSNCSFSTFLYWSLAQCPWWNLACLTLLILCWNPTHSGDSSPSSPSLLSYAFPQMGYIWVHCPNNICCSPHHN